MDLLALLRRLSETPGVAGYENAVRQLITTELSPLVDELGADTLGNLIGLKRGSLSLTPSQTQYRLMLAAHMDEIGLMVAGYSGAFLKVVAVGGVDPRILPGQEVVVHTAQGPLPGVVATRPTAGLPAEQQTKTLPLDSLLIDVGLTEAEVRERVEMGDTLTVHRPLVELQNGRLASKAMDNRASVAILLGVLEGLRGRSHAWDVYAVATVQEEVGLRGAYTSAYRIMPQIGIALDMGFGEQPGIPDIETFPLGEGPSIGFGPNIHPRLHERLMATAKTHEIPVHFEPMPTSSGTDAMAIQMVQAGVATAVISIPTRYMHTPVETLALRDIERTVRLLVTFITELDTQFLTTLTL